MNNAGVSRKIAHRDLGAVERQDWQSVLDVNLLATWELSRAAAPHLRATGDGCIVNVTSLVARTARTSPSNVGVTEANGRLSCIAYTPPVSN